MTKKLIVGNWKLNPPSLREALSLTKAVSVSARKSKNISVVICPPFPFLGGVGKATQKTPVYLGSQDVFYEEQGAFTGLVSAPMLKDIGVSFVIVGHSERRMLGDTEPIINKKLKSALKNKLIPILCIGEKDRDSHGYYLASVKKQIESAFMGIPGTLATKTIIAYEPIWAVGNKNFKGASPEDAVEMAILIRRTFNDIFRGKGNALKVLYGGSVSKESAKTFIEKDGIDGLLVGRESLNAVSFSKIILGN